jgi:predicted CopG family antitoxin
MVTKDHRNITLHIDTYEKLRHMGVLTESFDDVIRRLIQKASSVQSLETRTK